jgi:hypothetical protein
MSDSYLDHLSAPEREKIRKRMRSPEAYEKLRERVKGPEDLEREIDRNDRMADAAFVLESQPEQKEAMKKSLEVDLEKQGMEGVLEHAPSDEARKLIEQGKFTLKISSHPKTHEDQLTVVTEGNVQEKIPVRTQLSDTYISNLLASEK